ncbi:MAG: hypothetical protein WEE89_21415 [Gemmatimonadota bacterium]
MKRAAILLVTAFLSGGCGWFEDPRPNDARLVVEGDAGKQVRLITSTRFVSAVNELGQTRVILIEADTAFVTLPIDQTYTIGGDERFFAETSRLDADLETVRMQVFLDRNKRFDEDGPLLTGQPYRFVYTFNQPVTREIVVI